MVLRKYNHLEAEKQIIAVDGTIVSLALVRLCDTNIITKVCVLSSPPRGVYAVQEPEHFCDSLQSIGHGANIAAVLSETYANSV